VWPFSRFDLLSLGLNHQYIFDRRLGDFQSGSGNYVLEKNFTSSWTGAQDVQRVRSRITRTLDMQIFRALLSDE
jgi:hypothetical protein